MPEKVEDNWEIWLVALHNLLSILFAVFPLAALFRLEADLHRNCPLLKTLTRFLYFPWKQQTLHSRGARGLQLKQGLSLRGTTDEDGLSLPLISLQFFCFSFLIYLCLWFVTLFMTPQIRTHILTSCSLSYKQTHTSRITRECSNPPPRTKPWLFPGPLGSSGTHGSERHTHT